LKKALPLRREIRRTELREKRPKKRRDLQHIEKKDFLSSPEAHKCKKKS